MYMSVTEHLPRNEDRIDLREGAVGVSNHNLHSPILTQFWLYFSGETKEASDLCNNIWHTSLPHGRVCQFGYMYAAEFPITSRSLGYIMRYTVAVPYRTLLTPNREFM